MAILCAKGSATKSFIFSDWQCDVRAQYRQDVLQGDALPKVAKNLGKAGRLTLMPRFSVAGTQQNQAHVVDLSALQLKRQQVTFGLTTISHLMRLLGFLAVDMQVLPREHLVLGISPVEGIAVEA